MYTARGGRRLHRVVPVVVSLASHIRSPAAGGRERVARVVTAATRTSAAVDDAGAGARWADRQFPETLQ